MTWRLGEALGWTRCSLIFASTRRRSLRSWSGAKGRWTKSLVSPMTGFNASFFRRRQTKSYNFLHKKAWLRLRRARSVLQKSQFRDIFSEILMETSPKLTKTRWCRLRRARKSAFLFGPARPDWCWDPWMGGFITIRAQAIHESRAALVTNLDVEQKPPPRLAGEMRFAGRAAHAAS